MLYKSTFVTVTMLLLFIVWGCDDSPTSADPEDAPDAPSLEDVSMDFSIFEEADTFQSIQIESHPAVRDKIEYLTENSLTENDGFSAFEQAAWFASFAELWFQTMGSLPATFFQEQQWGNPDIDGDTWVWEWNFSYEGESITMTVTAETVGNERHWELRYTTQGMEEDLDNALLIASQIRLDGSGGAWQLHAFFEDEEDPLFEVDYDLEGELTTMVEMKFNEEGGGRFLYQREDDQSSLEMWDVIDSGHSILEWNNETGTGSIQSPGYRGGDRVCWDENFRDTEC